MTPRQQDTAPLNRHPRKFDRDWLQKLLASHEDSSTALPEFRQKALAVAPMVDQSDLPFRLLCRQYGANLAFTPMIHAKMFMTKPTYQAQFLNTNVTPAHDRPLIAQLCGSDVNYVLQTALLLQPYCDGIDLNCGCPQGIAKRGMYGAYLLEQQELLLPVVETLSKALDIPVSVKVRLLPSGVDDSLTLYRALVDAGASMLTIHGRNRFQKGPLIGRADWEAIRRAVSLLPEIPILANGSISSLRDARECLEYTGAAGVMSSEALLEYPPIFLESVMGETRTGPGRLQLAREYLALAKEYPPERGGQGSGLKCLRAHLHRFLHADMQEHNEIRHLVTTVETLQELQDTLDKLQEIHNATWSQGTR